MQTTKKGKETLDKLRKEILCLQGLAAPLAMEGSSLKLGPIQSAMPNKIFPTGAIHELLSNNMEEASATGGFIIALLHSILQTGKPCIWVSTHRTIFPPALKVLGIDPDQIIFIDAFRGKEALWTVEEALKCDALSAVIGEIKEVDFTQSRRWQLAVENSHVTGFIHRIYPRNIRPTACVSRWHIQPTASQPMGGLPGVGFPCWKVELLKIRNGSPGIWQLEWRNNTFHTIHDADNTIIPLGKSIIA